VLTYASDKCAPIRRAASSIGRDRDSLAYLQKSLDTAVVAAIAKRIHDARRTVVLAQGSYASIGLALAHNASICGYDVMHISDPATMANTMARLGDDDLLIGINCWQF
jgi:DNA-binding MurR/RpiR family transcriptional regulator